MVVAAIDPGREKCGVAIVDEDGHVLDQAVVVTARLADELTARVKDFRPECILLGNGTTSHAAEEAVRAAVPDILV